MQEGYQPDQPDVIRMKLVFNHISMFSKDDSDFEDVDILQVNLINENTLEFVTQDDCRECYIFIVTANEIIVSTE